MSKSGTNGDSETGDTVVLALPWGLSHAGGVNVVVRALIDQFENRHGLIVRVLIPEWSAKRLRERCIDGRREAYSRLRPPAGNAGNLLKATFMYWATLPASLLRLGRWFRRHNVKYVNVHYPGLWAFNLVLLRLVWRGAPRVVLSFHGTDLVQADYERPRARRLMRWMVCRADGVTACSRQLGKDVARQFGLPPGAVIPIHNGIDVQGLRAALDGAKTVPEMTDGRRWLLSIGTFESNKGQGFLLDAFARLAKELPDVALMLVGRDGGALEGLQQRTHELRLKDRVCFKEDMPHSEIPQYLCGADIFVLSSKREAFGIVLLEAGMARLPVVASRVGGVPEVIDSPECGLLVEPENPDALYQAFCALFGDETRRREMGQALNERVLASFSWEQTADQYLSVLQGSSGE